jgi:hypothetical protein
MSLRLGARSYEEYNNVDVLRDSCLMYEPQRENAGQTVMINEILFITFSKSAKFTLQSYHIPPKKMRNRIGKTILKNKVERLNIT